MGHLWSQTISLGHGWGWQPPQTASHIHIGHVQSVWAHWYVSIGIQYYPYTVIPTLLSLDLGLWVTCWVKWCDYVMVEADSQLKLLTASILDICKNFEHIDMLSICTWQQPYTVIPTLLCSDFGVLGHLLSQNDVIMSWLRLEATSNCFPHPY